MIARGSRVHFVGIGGIGMSGLATVLLSKGVQVSGSDLHANYETAMLQHAGAEVHQGHSANHVSKGLDRVIVSSAIASEHEELRAARDFQIPVVPRLRALGEVMTSYRSIGIAGTHGKSTTTAMVATILREAGLDASFLIGAQCPALGSNAYLGSGEWFSAEIDESDGLLVELTAEVAVLTNIGRDHLHTYGNLEEIEQAFRTYLSKARTRILAIDDARVARIADELPLAMTVAIHRDANLRAVNLRFDKWNSSFDILMDGERICSATIPVPGEHNVENALCALAAAHAAGVPVPVAARLLGQFALPHRRFELLEENGVTVVDDYAHLPEEISATIRAIRNGWPGRRVLAVFQPHRYSRTQALGEAFGHAFADADIALITPIYAAHEARIPGVSSRQVLDAINRDTSCKAIAATSKAHAIERLKEIIEPGDFIISFGAGDVWTITERLAHFLEQGEFLGNAARVS